jgi:hypothetical protein
MENRISAFYDDRQRQDDDEQPIGKILAELLAQYEARFPEVRIAIIETPVAA